GEAVCRRLATEGAAAALLDRNAARLDTLCDELAAAGSRVAAFPADVGDETAVQAAVDGAGAALGPLPGIVTSAGIFPPVACSRWRACRCRRSSTRCAST